MIPIHLFFRIVLLLLIGLFLLGNLFHPVPVKAQEVSTSVLLITTEFNDDLLEKAALLSSNIPDSSNLTIVIDSPGGKVYVEDFIISSIKMKRLTTTCIVPSYAASAAAMLTTTCNIVRTPDTAVFVFHMAFVMGPNGEKIRSPELIKKELEKEGPIMKKILTKEQFKEWLNGGDVFISGNQLKEKLDGSVH